MSRREELIARKRARDIELAKAMTDALRLRRTWEQIRFFLVLGALALLLYFFLKG